MDVWRECSPRVLAALLRRYRDFDDCEDALQEALLAASRQWPVDGTPADPTAWLVRVASRRVLDQWRSERARTERERVAALEPPPGPAPETDDAVALMLLCCHPALPRPAQVALTLRAVAGLSTAQIARGFLVPEATMAQRISRAKARLREAGARFAAPDPRSLPALTTVLYLVFTEGHASTAGAALYDPALSEEAIRLTRELHRRLPGESEVTGLLALMLLTDARRAARVGTDGALVPLAEQDRSGWDRARIREGVALLEHALPAGPVGPYQLQAAIAAVHAEAPSAADTDWRQIETLYSMLERVAPGPVVTLNHAVAVAMVSGPQDGLRLLEPLQDDPRMRRHHRWHAVRAHLLELADHPGAAREAYLNAAPLASSIAEQRHLRAAADRVFRASSGPSPAPPVRCD